MRTLLTTATSLDVAALQPHTAIVPIGSSEQRDGLPLITDTIVAQLIAARLVQDYDLFLLPPATVSCSQEHAGLAGTVSISSQRVYQQNSTLKIADQRVHAHPRPGMSSVPFGEMCGQCVRISAVERIGPARHTLCLLWRTA